MISTTFTQWPLAKQHVLVRIDGNVPLHNDTIVNDFRLRAVEPTIRYLCNRGAFVTLITHIGNPRGYDPSVSTRPIAFWFNERQMPVLVLENTRFDPREKKGDQKFSQTLAHGHDYFINDAWGTMHRNDASIVALAKCFAPEQRSCGFLVQLETEKLSRLRNHPKRPFTLFLGGGKTIDKLRYLPTLIEQERLNHLVILPGIAHTFLAANGANGGKSPVHNDLFELCNTIKKLCHHHHVELHLPVDLLVGEGSWQGVKQIRAAESLQADDVSISIGPKSLETFQGIINRSESIFFNGIMGEPRIHGTLEFSERLLTAIGMSSAYTVIGGGDTVTLAERCNLSDYFSFCSSGGGSTLAYIAGTQLPGLSVFENQ
ncbi:MAG: Phosphoglycerate kinase [candidate division TM6 bacterium GW2011_GWF2_43_17]|nr:MAG: Phosphoglycerate kinase [candidate division TM6 bacterium GW2011_GWF2_43_17]HAU30544.1 hypothetical protein [Candidatus Dependentiae bacterium]